MPYRNAAGPLKVAGIVFLVSGGVEYVMNDMWARVAHHTAYRYLDCVVVATVVALLFYLWRRQYVFYISTVEAYSASRRFRIHRIRSILQIMMYHARDSEEMKEFIRMLDAIIDEPALDPFSDISSRRGKHTQKKLDASALK